MSCAHLRSMTCLTCRRKGLGWDDDHDERIRGALLALARVGVWVGMESCAWREKRWKDQYRGGDVDIYRLRVIELGLAVQEGRFRLDWSEG